MQNFLLSFLIIQIILYQQHKEVVVIWILALPFINCVCCWEFLTVSQPPFLDSLNGMMTLPQIMTMVCF